MAIRQILWDWNGTLLDDFAYAMDVRNRTFPRFGLPIVSDAEEYRRQFTFPIRVYYERAGATDENFDAVAHAWMDEYMRNLPAIPLHADARPTVERFRAAGLKQVVLSASERTLLLKQLALSRLDNSFDQVLGLNDIYARSKEAIGRRYLRECGVPPEDTAVLGDTLHDAEVAAAMGTRCVLIARGHQGRKQLETAGVPVVDNLVQAADRALMW